MTGVHTALAAPLARQATPPRSTVAITRLTLTDFRCYGAARIEVDARPVVLVGPNGAGKTNVLEAISFLAPGRGLRGAKLAEAARRLPGEDAADATPGSGRAWAVAARISGPLGETEIGVGRDALSGEPGIERRAMRIDGRTVSSQAALADVFSAVWLTPQMDGLLRDGASARRRFLDRLAYGYDPAHAGRVTAWEKAMRERSRLLREGCADRVWLDALESTMAERGVAVAAARRDMAERLDQACATRTGVFPRAAVTLSGALSAQLRDRPALEVEDWMRQRLAESRGSDSHSGGAAEGPHRCDLVVRHRDRNELAETCSTGEQKALLIAMVLANASLQALERGSPPVLLLDEVVAHLDGERRTALYDQLCDLGGQVWLTGTDVALFQPLRGRAQFLAVEQARLMPLSDQAQ